MQFRGAVLVAPEAKPSIASTVRVLVDEDFTPFSFRESDGSLHGLALDVAVAACTQARLTCTFAARPWAALIPALVAREGDVVLAGPPYGSALLERFSATRPYYVAGGTFLVRKATPIDQPRLRTLAGKRLGVVAGSQHEAWIQRTFPQASIMPFPDAAAAYTALRTGTLDVLFADGLANAFWLKGTDSQGCCRSLPGTFREAGTISPALAIVARPEDTVLIAAFDQGLDRVQTSGSFAEIFRRYVPAMP